MEPCQIILRLETEISPKTQDGKISGSVVDLQSHMFTVGGKDLDECKNKIAELIENIEQSYTRLK